MSGKVARMIGTAPPRPPQEINSFSLTVSELANKVIKTAVGRAISIRNRDRINPIPITGRI